ncbi:MAG: hypothetical protein NC398_06510 [Acetatifactor muris]|nr:hypothetical protein [Acetatifactor muris]MCM1526599.1 hypothetical protein [Bacteroides sp.]
MKESGKNQSPTKRNKLKIAAAAVIIVLLIALGCKTAREIYNYNHLDIVVHYTHSGGGPDFNVDALTYYYTGGSNWFLNRFGEPYSERTDQLMSEWDNTVGLFQAGLGDWYAGRPADVRATVQNVDGHTVFTYQGYVTAETGEIVEIDEEIVMSGILTENLPQPLR